MITPETPKICKLRIFKVNYKDAKGQTIYEISEITKILITTLKKQIIFMQYSYLF